MGPWWSADINGLAPGLFPVGGVGGSSNTAPGSSRLVARVLVCRAGVGDSRRQHAGRSGGTRAVARPGGPRTSEQHTSPFESSSVPVAYREHLEPVVFRPWAQRLITCVGLTPGQSVLDVASGTGVVARAAASVVGPTGAVIASDLSPAMLTQVRLDADPAVAPITTLVCSADDLAALDASVDVVLCQQGMQFFPDRAAAVREMHRVFRPGGAVGVAVWSSSARVEPFDTYSEVLEGAGVDPPFPGAFQHAAHSVSADDVRDVLGRRRFPGRRGAGRGDRVALGEPAGRCAGRRRLVRGVLHRRARARPPGCGDGHVASGSDGRGRSCPPGLDRRPRPGNRRLSSAAALTAGCGRGPTGWSGATDGSGTTDARVLTDGPVATDGPHPATSTAAPAATTDRTDRDHRRDAMPVGRRGSDAGSTHLPTPAVAGQLTLFGSV